MLWLVGTTGPPQRPFLGEDVARREFGRAGKGQVFAHGVRPELARPIDKHRTRMPRAIEVTCRSADPRWYPTEPVLLGQIFGNCPNQCIEPFVVRQCGFLRDRNVARFSCRGEIESIDEFRQRYVPRSAESNSLDGLSDRIWTPRMFLAR